MHQINTPIKCTRSTTVQSERPFIHLATHRREKNVGYSIQYFYGTWNLRKLKWQLISTEKKYVFVSGHSITIMHGTLKNQFHWTINEKNIFSFLTTLQCGAQALDHTEKKMFLATVLDVYGTLNSN